jgi:uncharacterized membrane protein
MRTKTSVAGALGLVLLGAVVSAVTYPDLPAQMVTSFDETGTVQDTMGKSVALVLFPAIGALSLGLFLLIPRIDPLQENIEAFREQYDAFIVLIVGVTQYVHVLVVYWNLGTRFSLSAAVAPAIGAIVYYAGYLFEHAERNWFVGIRTPWTLSNERVWRRTHDRGAALFKIAGGLAVLGVVAGGFAIWFVVAPVAGAALYLTAYSYLEYRRLDEPGDVEFP